MKILSRRNISIKRKLIFITMLSSAAALLTAYLAFITYDLYIFSNEMKYDLSILGEVIISNSTSAVFFNDEEAAAHILSSLKAQKHITEAGIYDRKDQIFAGYQRDGQSVGTFPKPESSDIRFQDWSLILFRDIIFNGEKIGKLYLKSDLQEITSRLFYYAGSIIIFVFGAALIIFFMITKLQKVITEPIKKLEHSVHKVSLSKDFSVRVEKASSDEVGVLVDSFNEMLEQIQERDIELNRLNSELSAHALILQNELIEKSKMEEALRKSELKYRDIFRFAPVGIYQSDLNGNFITANQSLADMLGFDSIEDLMQKKLGDDIYYYPHDRVSFIDKFGPKGMGTNHEIPWRKKDNSQIWVNLDAHAVKDKDGRIAYFEGFVRDITEKKKSQEEISVRLQEKEVLLKEIHHRVKNNLQVISSLLYLQAKDIRDQKVSSLFQESRNRVKSMALVHEKLYQSNDLARINFSEYTKNLVESLLNSYLIGNHSIKLKINTQEVFLGIDVAISCGLIINELVTNSMKYAFPNGKKGEILIDLSQDEQNDEINLKIGDNGIGLPENFDINEVQSLGLRLVSNLASQINGSLTLNRNGGTIFLLNFSEGKK